jgi:hypothetical protein
VTTSTTAPSTTKERCGWSTKKRSAYQGLTEAITSGCATIPRTPSTAIEVNQASMIHPNSPPTLAVPFFCTAKSTAMITKAMGTTKRCSPGVATSSPSTALSTEIAGVMIPSP